MRERIDLGLAVNPLAAAFTAAFLAQVVHELSHGITALMVGAQWRALSLFAVLWESTSALGLINEILIEALPALINIGLGAVGVLLFQTQGKRGNTMFSLFWLYFAGYNLLMGLGYLLVDSLFYQAGSEQLRDWQKVIELTGGSWALRGPLIFIGAGGILWCFFFLARSALRFAEDATIPARRLQVALPLLLVPYVLVNIIFTALALSHPLGISGTTIVGVQYWFGYVGFFWAFFLAAYWLDVKQRLSHEIPQPSRLNWRWVLVAGVSFLLALILALPQES